MGVLLSMWEALKHIFIAPFQDLSVFWLLIPILILWIVMEVYFDLHKNEELGWNSALGNGVSMFWIGISLMRHIFTNNRESFTWMRFLALAFILSYAIFIVMISFKHVLSAKVTFLLASPTPMYYLSCIAILWAYGSLKLGGWVILDLLLIFPIIIGIEMLFRKFLPEAKEDVTTKTDDFKM